MSGLQPVALWGLRVPAGEDEPTPATDINSAFQIKMAAIDPTAKPKGGAKNTPHRATLKIIRLQGPSRMDPDYDDGDDDSDDSDEDDSEVDGDEDEEMENGPSNKKKVDKALMQAQLNKLANGVSHSDDDGDVSMDGDLALNGAAKKDKGKSKATNGVNGFDDSDDDSEDELLEGLRVEEYIICTLDPQKTYQLPLDLMIGSDEKIFFKASGAFDIHLTGNYVITDAEMNDGYDSDEADLSPYDDVDLLADFPSNDESESSFSRVVELGPGEDEGVPLLTKKGAKAKASSAVANVTQAAGKKAKADEKTSKKRSAEESSDEDNQGAQDIDAMIEAAVKSAEVAATAPSAKDTKPAESDPKLNKKQRKKMKNNEGNSIDATPAASKPAPAEATEKKSTPTNGKAGSESPAVKKVQFADSVKKDESKKQDANTNAKAKPALGIRIVQGVTVHDRVLGKGPMAKKGDKVGMYYVGKLEDGKQFDKCGKGKPFAFKLGAGEVIKGWDIGVAGMSIGGQRQITIPADLAYGKKGMPGIPGNSKLIFDVKMMEIK